MLKKAVVKFLSIGIILGCFSTAQSTPIQWSGNNHAYDVVFIDGNPTWYEAKDMAASMTYNGSVGYLATFTTAAEQNFVINSFGGGAAIDVMGISTGSDAMIDQISTSGALICLHPQRQGKLETLGTT